MNPVQQALEASLAHLRDQADPGLPEEVQRLIRAARKLAAHPGHYPTHLGACIGVLSEPSCQCGVADVLFAVRGLDRD